MIGIVDLDDADPEFTLVLPWTSRATYPDWHPPDDRIVFQLPDKR